jgi:hypothetical protein
MQKTVSDPGQSGQAGNQSGGSGASGSNPPAPTTSVTDTLLLPLLLCLKRLAEVVDMEGMSAQRRCIVRNVPVWNITSSLQSENGV